MGLDGSPAADIALEQAVLLARRAGATLVLAYAHEPGASVDPALLERGRFRVVAGGLPVEGIEQAGESVAVLAGVAMAQGVDATIIGRPARQPGETAGPLVRGATRRIVVCGGALSPVSVCAVAYDDSEASQRALRFAMQLAALSDGEVQVLYAGERATATSALSPAESALSMHGVRHRTHVRAGDPTSVVITLVRETRADVLVTGAHRDREARADRTAGTAIVEEILRETTIPIVVEP